MLNIARNESALIDSLFSGKTADGYVQVRKKRQVDFICRGREYCFNSRGELQVRDKYPNGKTWYRPPAEDEKLFRTSYDEYAAAESLARGYDRKGYYYR